MSGFVSFFASTFLFVICFAFFIVYFTQGKRRNHRAVWSWGIASFIFAGIGIAYGFYYLAPTPVAVKQRPYVFTKDTRLQNALTAGEKPVFTFVIANSGPVEAEGLIKDFTFTFTINPERRTFEYVPNQTMTFSLAPTAQWQARINMDLLLTDEKIKALKEGAARLFFYAYGEYKGESGQTYPLKLCYMYDRGSGGLAICGDEISVTKQIQN